MRTRTGWVVLLSALAVLAPMFARADDDEEEAREHQRARPAPLASPLYESECGSCHLAFPARLLPARSWTALLDGLADHFGENAEVDAKTRQQLLAYLVPNAGRDPGGPTPLRITTLRWWRKEHDEVTASTYQRRAVTSPANCGACHGGASRGDFDEHSVKIPRDAPAPR